MTAGWSSTVPALGAAPFEISHAGGVEREVVVGPTPAGLPRIVGVASTPPSHPMARRRQHRSHATQTSRQPGRCSSVALGPDHVALPVNRTQWPACSSPSHQQQPHRLDDEVTVLADDRRTPRRQRLHASASVADVDNARGRGRGPELAVERRDASNEAPRQPGAHCRQVRRQIGHSCSAVT